MTLISDLIGKLEALPTQPDKSLVLDAAALGLQTVTDLLSNVLGGNQLSLGGGKVTAAANGQSVTVTGTAPVFGLSSPISVTITFVAQPDGSVDTTLDATPASTFTLGLSALPWISLGAVGMQASMEGTFSLVRFQVQGTLNLGQGASAVAVPLVLEQLGGTEWEAGMAPGAIVPVPGLDALASLFGGEAATSFFPPGLVSLLAGLSLTGVGAHFDTATKSVTYFSAGLTATNGWSIIPQIPVAPGMTLLMTIQNPTDQATRVVTGTLTATASISGTSLPIFAQVSSSGPWMVALAPDQTVTLPSFSRLFDLGGADLSGTLPAALGDIPSIVVSALEVDFDPYAGSITAFTFAAATASTWPIITGYFEIAKITASFAVASVTDVKNRTVQGSLVGNITLGSVPVVCSLAKTSATSDWTVTGALAPGAVVNLGDVAASFFDKSITVPAPLNPSFNQLSITVVPATRAFHFTAGSTDTWPILPGVLSINSFLLDFSRDPSATTRPITGSLAGTVSVVGLPINLTASINDTGAAGWQLTGATAKGQSIDLTKLAQQLLDDVGIQPPSGVPSFAISDLSVAFNTGDKSFSFHGQTADPWVISLGGTQVAMTASVDVSGGGSAAKTTVTLAGTWIIGSTAITIACDLATQTFTAKWGSDLELDVTFTNGDVVFGFNNLPVGQAIGRLVALADPNFAFDLPSPWSALDQATVSGALEINPSARSVSFTLVESINLLDVITITSVTAGYAKGTGVSVSIAFSSSIPGLTSPFPAWDAVNQPAPSTTAIKAPFLELRYLGLGQHISLTNIQNLTTVGAIMSALEAVPVVAPPDPATSLQGFKFDAGAGWFAGIDFTLLGTVSLSIIFDDPTVYGLLISLAAQGGRAPAALAGLSFEILYRKIADNLGLYHVDLALPTEMRHIELGDVSITLPHIVLDVYTNGNFLVDFGFPYNGDFSQSLAVEVLPFTGAGGFYFGVLDGQTSTAVPQLPQDGSGGAFNPVIVFGMGLQVGVGKTFDEGPLSAGVLVAVEGIVEGVLAFYQPPNSNPKNASAGTYWALTGSVGISAHVYGSIDFYIVQASVDLYVFASVQIAAACAQPILLEISAGVSVSLSVRVCGFISIHLSFSMTIQESFTIPGVGTAPWQPYLEP